MFKSMKKINIWGRGLAAILLFFVLLAATIVVRPSVVSAAVTSCSEVGNTTQRNDCERRIAICDGLSDEDKRDCRAATFDDYEASLGSCSQVANPVKRDECQTRYDRCTQFGTEDAPVCYAAVLNDYSSHVTMCSQITNSAAQQQCQTAYANCNRVGGEDRTACREAVLDDYTPASVAPSNGPTSGAGTSTDPNAPPETGEPVCSNDASAPNGCNRALVCPVTRSDDAFCGFIDKYINPGIKFLSGTIGIICVIMIITGGIQYTMAGGLDPNGTKVMAAKKRIFNAIFALVAFGLLYAFLSYLLPGGV